MPEQEMVDKELWDDIKYFMYKLTKSMHYGPVELETAKKLCNRMGINYEE